MSFQQDEKLRLLSQFDLFKNGIDNTPEDKRQWKPEEHLMSPQQLMEHLTGSNYFFAAMLKGEAPPTAPDDAPTLSFAEAQAAFEASCTMMADTIASIPDADLDKAIALPNGATAALKFMMTVPGNHIAYHWGQLSYLQLMFGDTTDHFFTDPHFTLGARY